MKQFFCFHLFQGKLIKTCITHPHLSVHNKFLITDYTDDENLPREVLNRLKPKVQAIFDHYKGKINYIPTEENNAEGTAVLSSCNFILFTGGIFHKRLNSLFASYL